MKEVPGNITGVAVHLNAQIIETNPGEFSTTIGIETAEPILSVPTVHLNAQIIETNPGEFSTTIGIETAEPILSVPTGH